MTMLAATPVYERGQFATSRHADPGHNPALQRELDALVAHDRTVFEFLMHVSLDGLWIMDVQMPEKSWLSPRFWELLGYDPEMAECRSSEWAGMLHPETASHTTEKFETFKFGSDTVFDEIMQFRHRDGSAVWLRARFMAARDAKGSLLRLIGALNDITTLKRLEAEWLRGQAELTASLAKASAANARLEGLAHVDSLTGLANRRRFDHVLQQEWRRAAREKESVSLVMVDLDRFKQFNDRYGHIAGDDCLRRVAMVVERQGRRATDLAARYGGEEMVLLLPATTAAGAEIVARDCRSAIAALGIWHEGNMSCGGIVTASFGVATALPTAANSETAGWMDLLAEADRLLYEAKRTGRNKVATRTSLARSAIAPIGVEEDARLASLARYEATGATRRSQEMDGIARLAATLTGAPIGLISLVGREELHFAGNFGLPGVDGTTRGDSFCAHTILGEDPMVVADATQDPRFHNSHLVTGDLGARYYAGAPIVSPTSGHKLGALCVVDTKAREKTGLAERAMLTDLAGMVAALLEANTRPVDRRQK